MADLHPIAAPFVAPGPSGVAVRTRLKDLTLQDEKVLRLVGAHLGSLASKDLKARCADGLEHSTESWAARKRGLTAEKPPEEPGPAREGAREPAWRHQAPSGPVLADSA